MTQARAQARTCWSRWTRCARARCGPALTILGIVIGVTSVISVAAIIDGLNGLIQDAHQIVRLAHRSSSRAFRPASAASAACRRRSACASTCEIADAQYLRENVPGLDIATAFAQRINFGAGRRTPIRYGNEHVERFFLRGAEPEYAAALPLFTVATGRFISQYDEEHARNVVVIGNAIADSLFPQIDPIGKTVRLNGRPYEVIGVFEKDPGLFGGFGVDQFACIPLTNFHKNYPEIRDVWLHLHGARRCRHGRGRATRWWKPCAAAATCRTTRRTISRSPTRTSSPTCGTS